VARESEADRTAASWSARLTTDTEPESRSPGSSCYFFQEDFSSFSRNLGIQKSSGMNHERVPSRVRHNFSNLFEIPLAYPQRLRPPPKTGSAHTSIETYSIPYTRDVPVQYAYTVQCTVHQLHTSTFTLPLPCLPATLAGESNQTPKKMRKIHSPSKPFNRRSLSNHQCMLFRDLVALTRKKRSARGVRHSSRRDSGGRHARQGSARALASLVFASLQSAGLSTPCMILDTLCSFIRLCGQFMPLQPTKAPSWK
jgi:hypothetical protein